jgi:hypothetical protein
MGEEGRKLRNKSNLKVIQLKEDIILDFLLSNTSGQTARLSVSTMQTYIKKMHYVMVSLLIKKFCCSKKVKGIIGIMKSPHQNFWYPLYI